MADLIDQRASGVLLHISSLPPTSDGRLGSAARQFVDWLVEAGQSYWQVLPVGPTGYGDSPYQTDSSFAGRADWLGDDATDRTITNDEGYRRFRTENPWLEEYGAFVRGKSAFSGACWNLWPTDFDRQVDETALIQQYRFDTAWQSLRSYANERGVRIIGDCPIYVAYDSAEVWSHRDLFDLDENGSPHHVAGVPPDYFAETGQRWGNPLYLWDRHRQENFAWWTARLRRCTELFDITRIDHFRGFDAYWAIDADCETAIEGQWLPGPGEQFFDVVGKALGGLPFIAEDLGLLTDSVHELRARCGLPGMRVLQFGFDGNPDNPHAPQNIDRDNICYTGTHDNDTTLGWYRSSDVKGHPEIDTQDPVGDLMRRASHSEACLTIFPVQDILRLGSEARLNTPGTVGGANWQWQLTGNELTAENAAELKEITQSGGRAPVNG